MTQADVLQAIVSDLVAFGGQADDLFADADLYSRGMRCIGVPYRPDHWHGKRLSQAQRMACSRAMHMLAAAGLVERVAERHRDRVTHVRLTVAGLVRALEQGAALDDVQAGLRHTEWGQPLIERLNCRLCAKGMAGRS